MNLRIKLVVLYGGLFLLLGVAYILVTTHLVDQTIADDEGRHFETLADAIARRGAEAMALQQELATLVGDITNMKQVMSACILDSASQVLAYTAPGSGSSGQACAMDAASAPAGHIVLNRPLFVDGAAAGRLIMSFAPEALMPRLARVNDVIFATGGLTTLIAVALSVWMAGRITRPVEALRQSAERVANGDFDSRVNFETRDEIGDLGRAFNDMAGRLDDNYRRIERAKKEWEDTFDAISDPLFIHDEQHRILRCNRAYAEAAGMPYDDIINRPYYDVYPVTGGPLQGCLDTQDSHEEREQELYAPCSGRHYNVKLYAIRDEQRRVLHYLHILDDISERKRAELELRASESSLREAQRIAHLGNWEWDIASGRLNWSDEIYRIFGAQKDAFSASYRNFMATVHPEDRQAVREAVDAALNDDAPYDIVHRIQRSDNSVRYVRELAEVVRDDGNRPLRLRGTVHDVTAEKQAQEDLRELFIAALTSLSNAIEAKSAWTRGHSERVAGYAVRIGAELGLTGEEINHLRIAALLHDIGKIGTYDGILEKPGKLTADEYTLIKQHPAKGADLLSPIKQLRDIIPWVRAHHERYDGGGYPDGLKGEQIPLQARILAVADTFDSMTAERPYRKTPGQAQAVEEMRRFAGIQFDPRVVDAFLKTVEAGLPQA